MTETTVGVEELKRRLGRLAELGHDPRDMVTSAHSDGQITTATRRELLAWLSGLKS